MSVPADDGLLSNAPALRVRADSAVRENQESVCSLIAEGLAEPNMR